MSIKQQLYNQCFDFVDDRLKTIQHTIKEIENSLTSETKSSAGDKHETGRSMLQLEREKAGKQLAEIIKIKENLSKIDVTNTSKIIGLGCVVYTSELNYFVAISAGLLEVNSNKFYAISPSTPIGKLILGKAVGEKIIFRNKSFTIIDVQ